MIRWFQIAECGFVTDRTVLRTSLDVHIHILFGYKNLIHATKAYMNVVIAVWSTSIFYPVYFPVGDDFDATTP